MRLTNLVAAAAVAVCFDTSSAIASLYCSKPSTPSCAERYGSFDDQDEFDRCKREMEDYKSEVESYLDCNNRQARSENEEAISGYEDAVESFNRRANN
ncbi:hypothetical protein [Mesorhizobium sp. 128a]